MRPSFWILIPIFVIASLAFAGDPSPEDPAMLSTPVGLADRLLLETSTAAEAARKWLRENLSKEAVNGYAASAEDSLNEKFNRALEVARMDHADTIGVFVYAPTGQSPDGPWARLGDGELLPPRVVLLVHGLDEGGPIWDNAAPVVAQAGYTVLRFNYPNDQRIAASAEGLVGALRDLRSRDVRTVDIIGHSMGGLVARDALTRREYYHGDALGGGGLPAVQRLIMLGTPNHGAPLASLRCAMEVRDQFVRWMHSEHKASSGLLGFMVDGHGEAGDDLRPGSAFLNDLNSRPLPSHVSMTIVVGEIASCGRERVTSALDSPYIRRVIGEERAAKLKSGTNGVWEEVGDGVVPTESTRLEGVTDVVHVAADHRSMIRVLEPVEATRNVFGIENPTPPAIEVVLDRLGR